MLNHPWPRSAIGFKFCLPIRGLRGSRFPVDMGMAASRSADVRRVATLFIAIHGRADGSGHQAQIGCRHRARRNSPANRAFPLTIGVLHHAKDLERTMTLTFEFVGGHTCLAKTTRVTQQSCGPIRHALLRSIFPSTALIGPSAPGRMSKSKISMGRASVAQALGISTMPLIRPSHGAVPRMA